jgi:hypothetical protein
MACHAKTERVHIRKPFAERIPIPFFAPIISQRGSCATMRSLMVASNHRTGSPRYDRYDQGVPICPLPVSHCGWDAPTLREDVTWAWKKSRAVVIRTAMEFSLRRENHGDPLRRVPPPRQCSELVLRSVGTRHGRCYSPSGELPHAVARAPFDGRWMTLEAARSLPWPRGDSRPVTP